MPCMAAIINGLTENVEIDDGDRLIFFDIIPNRQGVAFIAFEWIIPWRC